MERTEAEKQNRQMLHDRKPLVFDKIVKHDDMMVRKECVGIVGVQYRYDCNFNCKHCCIQGLKRPSGRMLTPADMKMIADQAHAMNLFSFCISGGEPILFPDLEEVVRAIGPDRFNIAMDSNGWALTEDKIKFVIGLGIDRIQLSMDGLGDVHDKFRKAYGSWERCVQVLANCKKHGLPVIVNVVATKSLLNSGGLVKYLDRMADFGNHVSIFHAKPVGNFADSQDEILDTKDFAYIESLRGKYNISTHQSPNCGVNWGCFCVKRMFAITAYGDLLPCSALPVSLGNIFEEPLRDIVDRGLNNKWFGYGGTDTCLAANKDSLFYQKVLPQIVNAPQQPISWKEVDWHF
jgi:MoaA/NifB/PqqE/SkfB family radical SAM enzyme